MKYSGFVGTTLDFPYNVGKTVASPNDHLYMSTAVMKTEFNFFLI
jgi:hypothetical protein